MSDSFVPHPEFIGKMYDKITELSKDMLGDNHHFGYFPDGTHVNTTMQEAADRMTDIVIDRLSISPGQRVLDLGCGTGRPAVRLAEAAQVEVVGITVSSEQLKIAKNRASTASVADRVQFHLMDATRMSFDNESFDAVVAIESLEHMPDQAHTLRSIANILRPGGRFVGGQPALHRVDDHGDGSFLRELYQMYNLSEQPFLDEYPQLFARAGLRVRYLEDVYRYVMLPTLKTINEWIQSNTARLSDLGDYGKEVVDLVNGMEKFAELPGAGFVIFAADKA